MKNIIKNPLMWVTYLMMSATLAILPLSMWVWSDAGRISVTTVSVSIIVALWLGFCFSIWPILLADGKWLYASWRIQAARDSMWSTKSTQVIYLKKHWLRFLLHACIVACITMVLYIVGDMIVLGRSNIPVHLSTMWFYALLFIVNILIVMLGRYMYAIANAERLPVSKHY